MIVNYLLWYEDKHTCTVTHKQIQSKNSFLFALSDLLSKPVNKDCPTCEAQLNDMQDKA